MNLRSITVLAMATLIMALSPMNTICASENMAQMPANTKFSDVPVDSWAAESIENAVKNGIMGGTGDGLFGYGKTITRAEFATVLCKMFGWGESAPNTPTFTDVSSGQWFYGYIESVAAHGVATGVNFNPNEPIIRKDMAVMLVKALGYGTLAEQVAKTESLPFSDIDTDAGYIIIAHDIGMIGGIGGGKFAPNNTSKREEAAAMLTRVYSKMNTSLDWLHGFYAFSSYNQREFIKDMNAVTFGWSAMEWDESKGPRLNTSSSGGNQWRVPDSYELIADYSRDNGAKTNLGVYMDTSMGLNNLLNDEKYRNDAIEGILNEVTRTYDNIGRSPYNGVTIDFEGLKGEKAKNEFTSFLTKLSDSLRNRGLALYVTVHPVTTDGQYFDGYDYRKIGQIADKVILMAHDYQPTSLDGLLGTEWQKNAPLTPLSEVYKALKAITDSATGVEDKSKIALAFNFACVGWRIDDNGKVKSPEPVMPSSETVLARMKQPDTINGWSEIYRNPHIVYTTENGEKIFLWYENSRSVDEKLKLARLFGVNGASVWRLGIIPNSSQWNVWADFK